MDPEQAVKMEKTVKPDFAIMVDREGRLVDLLGIRHKGGNPINGQDLPQSASFLISREGKLIWHVLARNYRVRPAPDEILAVARAKM
jgi:peroxiredoxin